MIVQQFNITKTVYVIIIIMLGLFWPPAVAKLCHRRREA